MRGAMCASMRRYQTHIYVCHIRAGILGVMIVKMAKTGGLSRIGVSFGSIVHPACSIIG